MANRLQHLRGSEAEHSTFTGAKGEISLVTDTSSDRIPTGEVRVHDGTTAGGLPLTLGTTNKPLTNNIVLGSGVGINFNNYGSEDSNSATTVGSNLLDDYEEGTFTTTISNAADVTVNDTGRTHYYTKIGNLLYCKLWFNITNASSGTPRFDFTVPFSMTASQININGFGYPYALRWWGNAISTNSFSIRSVATSESAHDLLISFNYSIA